MFKHLSPLGNPFLQVDARKHFLLTCQVLREDVEDDLVIDREAVVVNTEEPFWKLVPK